jgi:drug/metabolite transporter (DMT)-like permease
MPQQSPHWRLALSLAILAAVCWGLLPIALRVALQGMDALTITWYRFTTAAVLLGSYLIIKGRLPTLRGQSTVVIVLMGVAIVGLTVNYVLFVMGVQLTTPAIAETVIQLSNAFLLLGGVVFFKDSFGAVRWSGFAMLFGGLLLFFNRHLPLLFVGGSNTGLGVLLLVIGALSWAGYGLAQKQLMLTFDAPQTLLCLYVSGALLLSAFAHPMNLNALNLRQLLALIFCCLNTLVAYGAFSESLRLWEVSRVAATVATAPLFTLLGAAATARWATTLSTPEDLNALAVLGAGCVVAGSAMCALGARARSASAIRTA